MNNINFEIYINKVLKQVHPSLSISKDSKSQLNYFLQLLTEDIVKEAVFLASGNIYMMKKSRDVKKTLTAREIQSALKSIFGYSQLMKHSVSEGVKAVSKFKSSEPGKRSKHKTPAKRSGLEFAPSKLKTLIKKYHNGNIGSVAPIYLAAIAEYITAEILELAGNVARDNKRLTISSRHLLIAIENDDEIKELVNKIDSKILGGGVQPNIHAILLPKK